MKEVRQVTRLKCDQCGKTRYDDGLPRIVPPLYHGWYHVTMSEKSYLTSLKKEPFGQKDFCTSQCLSEFMLNLSVEERPKPPMRIGEDGVLGR